jgi:acetone carboxylase gamma subunit
MKAAWKKLRQSWCHLMHPAPMWPVHGHYFCPRCGLAFSVPWEAPTGYTDENAGFEKD